MTEDQLSRYQQTPMTAEITADQTAYEGSEVLLDGSTSRGLPGRSFLWEQLEGPPVALMDGDTPIARFIAPAVESDAVLVFRLTISRGRLSVSQTTTVLVLPLPPPPPPPPPPPVPVEVGILASIVEGEAPLNVAFEAYAVDEQSPHGLPEGIYAWEFGDGASAEGWQVTHVFAQPGSYMVSLCPLLSDGFVSTGCSQQAIAVRDPAEVEPPGPLHISGHIRSEGAGLGSVVISASDGGSTAVTDVSGFYEVTVPRNWSGTVVPEFGSYAFVPPSYSYASLAASAAGQDFDAVPPSHVEPNPPPLALPGTVSTGMNVPVEIVLQGTDPEGEELTFSVVSSPEQGVLSGIAKVSPTSAKVTYTPAAGYAGSDSFSFQVHDGQQYSEPATISITIDGATPPNVTISGQILDHSSSPRAGITLFFTGSGGSSGISLDTVSAGDGTYEQMVPAGWTGTVTSDQDSLLDPPHRTYTAIQSNQTGQNYVVFRNYYVATTGSDSAPGTFSQPLRTPQKAADLTHPGDTVYIREGTYTASGTAAGIAVLRITRNGLPGRPITYAAYPGETAILSGEDTRFDALAVSVRPSDQQPSSGVGVQHILIEGLTVEGATRSGIAIYGPVNLEPPTAHITVRRCIARDNIGSGIGTRGKMNNVVIEYCEAYQNMQTAIGFGRLSKNYHVGEPEDDMNAASYSTVRHCLAYDNVYPSTPGNTDGMGASHSFRCTFEDNVVFGNSDDGIDIYASLEVTVSRNIVFNHNHPEGNGAGIKVSAGGGGRHLLVRNVSFDNKSYGLEASSPSLPLLTYRASTFYHNLAYRTGSPALSIGGGNAEGIWTVYNNIAVEASGGTDFRIWSPANTVSDHNFWRSSDLAQGQSAGQDMNSLTGDPGFLNPGASINTAFGAGWTIEQKLEHIRTQVRGRFSLNSSSVCRNAGKDVGLDFSGPAPDIGPYESQ